MVMNFVAVEIGDLWSATIVGSMLSPDAESPLRVGFVHM